MADLREHDGNMDRSTWPTPNLSVAAAVGRQAEEAAQLYREDGFLTEIVDLDINTYAEVTMDRRATRIRLYTRGGRVESAAQG